MATYRYKTRDKTGLASLSTMEAESPQAVAVALRKQGLQIVYVEESKGLPIRFQGILGRLGRPSRAYEVTSFTRQLALMVRSGVPLVDGIEAIQEQPFSVEFKKTLRTLVEDLRRGKSLSEALQQHPESFSRFYVSMAKSAEAGGILEEVLERLASVWEEDLELKGRVLSALAYPILLVFLSLGIVSFLLINILPKFVRIFEESEVVLPLPTRILLWVSDLLAHSWFLIPVGLGLTIPAFLRYARTPQGRFRLHSLLLRVPFFGDFILKTIFARSFRVMASLLKSGIAAVPALGVMEDLMGNEVLSRAVARVRDGVVAGQPISEPFKTQKIFPPTVVQLVAVAERTGSLDQSFLHLGDFYEKEVERGLKAFASILEPALLLIMGLMVGFIALSILLPIFQLVRVFHQR